MFRSASSSVHVEPHLFGMIIPHMFGPPYPFLLSGSVRLFKFHLSVKFAHRGNQKLESY